MGAETRDKHRKVLASVPGWLNRNTLPKGTRLILNPAAMGPRGGVNKGRREAPRRHEAGTGRESPAAAEWHINYTPAPPQPPPFMVNPFQSVRGAVSKRLVTESDPHPPISIFIRV